MKITTYGGEDEKRGTSKRGGGVWSSNFEVKDRLGKGCLRGGEHFELTERKATEGTRRHRTSDIMVRNARSKGRYPRSAREWEKSLGTVGVNVEKNFDIREQGELVIGGGRRVLPMS